MNKKLFEILKEIRDIAESKDAGNDGPTLKELQEHSEETGMPWGDEVEYHDAQTIWRLVEKALKEEK